MTWFDDLYQRVGKEGQRPHVLESGSGRLLLAEHGARVLACELPGVDHNLFFHTDRTDDGQITGGDRLWVAPEVAYFWPNLDEALRDPKGTAVTPTQVDPAEWRLCQDESESTCSLSTRCDLQDNRVGKSLSVHLTRRWRAEDLSTAPIFSQGGLNAIGFINENEVALPTEKMPISTGVYAGAAGAWSILQVPPTGTLICPVSRDFGAGDEIRSYYEAFGEGHVVIEDLCVKFLIDGRRRIKMGIRPEHTTGRMGYYRKLGEGRSSLIVRIFYPLPDEPYCDLPRDDPRHRQLEADTIESPILGGDCLQAYNDDGDAFPGTSFGEMEYHDPCVVVGAGVTSRSGESITFVVVGPDAEVRTAGKIMLGVPVNEIN